MEGSVLSTQHSVLFTLHCFFFANRLQFVGLGIRVFECRTRRGLDDPVKGPLILARDKTGRELRAHRENADSDALPSLLEPSRHDALRDEKPHTA